MSRVILAIDQGTTGTTALVIDFSSTRSPEIMGRATVDFPQHYPQPGWVEHDLDQIWASVEKAGKQAIAAAQAKRSNFVAKEIAALGITNQRETLCIYDRKTLKPLRKAIVWQCRRSTEICEQMKADGLEAEFKAKTGLLLDPYFSGTKLRWVIDHEPEIAKALANGSAIVGTIDTFLISRLTGGMTHCTEPSNASRTLLYNLQDGKWDDALLHPLKITNRNILPTVGPSAGDFGKTYGAGFLPDGIPITGVLGDQQAALAGQKCFSAGKAKCTYGTGAFLLINTGSKPVLSQHGLLTTVAWQIGSQMTYALEGSAFIAGAAMQFIRDNLGFIATAAESSTLAQDVQAAPDIYFVPALAGLGAPWWNPRARGAFLGLTRGTTKAQLVRATLESIALQVNDLLATAQRDYSGGLEILRVDGGAAANDLLMQLQANFARVAVERPKNLETTAFGAALFAALGAGFFSSLDELSGIGEMDREFAPDEAQKDLVAKQLSGWKRAVEAIQHF